MRPRTTHDERGSITIFYLLAALGMALIVGLAVDLGAMVYTKQRAADIATQAARVAGESVQAAPAMHGSTVTVDAARGREAALAYIASAGMTGTVTVDATTIDVVTQTSYTPAILGAFGFASRTFTASASARLVRAVDGTEQ